MGKGHLRDDLMNFYSFLFPRCSMSGILTYIWVIVGVNVCKYSIHGASGFKKKHPSLFFRFRLLASAPLGFAAATGSCWPIGSAGIVFSHVGLTITQVVFPINNVKVFINGGTQKGWFIVENHRKSIYKCMPRRWALTGSTVQSWINKQVLVAHIVFFHRQILYKIENICISSWKNDLSNVVICKSFTFEWMIVAHSAYHLCLGISGYS